MGCSVYNPVACVIDVIDDLADEVVDTIEDNVIDPIIDIASGAVDYFSENIYDPLNDSIEDYGDYIESIIEDASEGIEALFEEIAVSLEDFFTGVGDFAFNTWGEIVTFSEDAWEWLEDSLDSAVDFLLTAAEKVYEFVVEDAIPYMIAEAEVISEIFKAIGALMVLPVCLLFKELFGEEEATVLESVAKHEPRILKEFNIERLPVNKKYVVFSDVHMYVDGDLNFFNNNGNAEIYQHALEQYSQNNYHLIENGDVEDFWMRGGSSKGLVLTISEQLPWPFYSEAFESSSFQVANQIHALNIFNNNSRTYSIIRTLFHNKNQYTKLIGNHDDVWSDAVMQPMLDVYYPGIKVNDYCTLENVNGKETEVIIAHGHQSDMFNMPMCSFAGKAMTNLASVVHELSLGKFNKFTKSKEDWMAEFMSTGFENKLQEIDLLGLSSFSEYNLYKDLESIYGDSTTQPYLILGHTHNPKDDALIPYYMFKENWNWDEYSNSGTVGMWEGIVIGLEVEYPNIDVIAWMKEQNGMIKKHVLKSYMYGDTYLKE